MAGRQDGRHRWRNPLQGRTACLVGNRQACDPGSGGPIIANAAGAGTMDSFVDDMRSRLPPGMTLPDPIAALFDWIEARGFLHPGEAVPGDRFGALQSRDEPKVGTIVLFRIETQAEALQSTIWLNRKPDAAVARRLVPIARTGSDGSHAAFWLDDAGGQHIVQLGSEGEACRLGSTPLDFLRLCAIGYTEIGYALDAPNEPPRNRDTATNAPFIDWLVSSFGVTVPRTATAILGDAPTTNQDDPFGRWLGAYPE